MNSKVVYIVMGPSGCGKSSVGLQLANKIGFTFIDADSFHSDESKRKMSNAISLTDEDRFEWISRIICHINQMNDSVVLACSCLKLLYRDWFRDNLKGEVFFYFLTTNKSILAQRLLTRSPHFFNPSLLESQIATLEPPTQNESNIYTIPMTSSVSETVDLCCSFLPSYQE